MGIIDDYYGGYETIAQFTNEEGETDFDAAYTYANDLDRYDDQEADQEEEAPEDTNEEDVNEDDKDDDGDEE